MLSAGRQGRLSPWVTAAFDTRAPPLSWAVWTGSPGPLPASQQSLPFSVTVGCVPRRHLGITAASSLPHGSLEIHTKVSSLILLFCHYPYSEPFVSFQLTDYSVKSNSLC